MWQERIHFGNFPAGATLRNVVVVQNLSTDSVLTFAWHVPAFWAAGERVNITPVSRTLQPGASCLCNLVYTSSHAARVLEKEVVCLITNETRMASYHQHKVALKHAKALNVNETLALSRGDEGVRARLAAAAAAAGTGSGELSRYKTLPPITGSKATAHGAADNNGKRASTSPLGKSALASYEVPPPPEPARLFVSLVGRSHHPAEFRQLFAGYEHYFLPPTTESAALSAIAEVASEGADLVAQCMEPGSVARDTILFALGDMLNAVFQDPDVQWVPHKLAEELPFYSQLQEAPRNGITLVEGQAPSGYQGREAEAGPPPAQVPFHLLGNAEFKSLVEEVLDLTLFNLMREANAKEFDLSTFGILIQEEVAKPPLPLVVPTPVDPDCATA